MKKFNLKMKTCAAVLASGVVLTTMTGCNQTVFDTEYTDCWENGYRCGRADYLSKSERTNIAIAFLERIKSAGYTPMLYSNKNFLNNNLDMSKLLNYKVWVAQYYDYCTYSGQYDMWQYSSTEYIPGIPGDTDVNVLFK